jgi:parvulin-like peptidyl-prolyl isomerase
VPQSVRRSGKPLFFGWGAHLTHHEREQTKERIAAAIGIVIALAVMGILINGWYQDNVAKPAAAAAARNKPVATVGTTTITTGWFHKVLNVDKTNLANQVSNMQNQLQQAQTSTSKKVKAEIPLIQSYLQQLQSQQSSLPTTTYQQLIDNAVIEQKGAGAGLKFDPAAQAAYLHNQIYNQFNGPAKFALQAQSSGLTSDELKQLLLMQRRFQLMQRVLAPKVGKSDFEVHVRHILIGPPVSDKATIGAKRYATLVATDLKLAQRVQHQLQHGGSWTVLAKKYSTDPGSKTKGGDYGWVGASTYNGYVPPYKAAALHQKLYTIAIIHSQFGYHVFQVLGRGQHPLSATAYAQAKQNALQTWLAKQQAIKGYVHQLSPPAASPLSGLPSSSGLP